MLYSNETETPNPNRDHRKRLRQRFERSGLAAFHDHEILELLLTLALPRKDVKPAAKLLLARFGTLSDAIGASKEDLMSIEGIGPNAATSLKFLHAFFGRLLKDRTRSQGPVLGSPQAVREFLEAEMSGLRDETFRVLFLDAKNRLIESEDLHQGTVNQTAVYPRKVLEKAFRHNAVSLIFAHNHPSGDPAPSEEDKRLTEVLARAAKSVDVEVHDHLIVGKGRIFSFRERGLLTDTKPGTRGHLRIRAKIT